MTKKSKSTNTVSHVVIFVEGDTDIIFFRELTEYYKKVSAIRSCEIKNIKGVSRYASSKIVGLIQNEIKPRLNTNAELYAVACSYDTDVYDRSEAPNINWSKLEKDIRKLGTKEFCRIEVRHCIEDWILDDIENVCKYLKLKSVPKNIKGNDGYQKLLNVYKSAGKVYFKGSKSSEMVKSLDMAKIRNIHKDALVELESILNVDISDISNKQNEEQP